MLGSLNWQWLLRYMSTVCLETHTSPSSVSYRYLTTLEINKKSGYLGGAMWAEGTGLRASSVIVLGNEAQQILTNPCRQPNTKQSISLK